MPVLGAGAPQTRRTERPPGAVSEECSRCGRPRVALPRVVWPCRTSVNVVRCAARRVGSHNRDSWSASVKPHRHDVVTSHLSPSLCSRARAVGHDLVTEPWPGRHRYRWFRNCPGDGQAPDRATGRGGKVSGNDDGNVEIGPGRPFTGVDVCARTSRSPMVTRCGDVQLPITEHQLSRLNQADVVRTSCPVYQELRAPITQPQGAESRPAAVSCSHVVVTPKSAAIAKIPAEQVQRESG
jgi:hypothetical protein